MSQILLPQRFLSQPQGAVELSSIWKRGAVIVAPLNNSFGRDIASGNHLVPGAATAPALVTRSHGKSRYFNGSSARLQSTSQVAPGAAFTAFAWARPSSLNAGYTRIIETDFASGFYLGSNTGSQYAWIVNNASLEGCVGGQQVAGQRDFVCGVFDGSNRVLYVNGAQVATSPATAPTAARTVYVGAYGYAGDANWWTGDIDTVGIYNRAFSAAEVFSLYQNPYQLFKAPARRIWVATSSDVTTALSGQAVTGSQGSLGVDTSVALSGQQATFSTGTLTPGAGAVVALTGQSLSWSQGALSPEISLPITGQSITGAQGSLGVSLDVGLSGQALAFSQGTIGIAGDITVALAGIAITASQGTLSPPVPSSGGFSGPLSFGKVKPRRHRDKDREEIRKSLLAQLEEKVEELQEDVSPPEVPRAIKSQVAQIAEEYQEPSIDLRAMEKDIRKVRALLKSYEEEVRRRRDEEDEELLFMFL